MQLKLSMHIYFYFNWILDKIIQDARSVWWWTILGKFSEYLLDDHCTLIVLLLYFLCTFDVGNESSCFFLAIYKSLVVPNIGLTENREYH